MSVKRLNGWEPTEVTTYEYDDAGRVTRTITRRESEWDESERQWALALLEFEASKCPGCGGVWEETTDPKSEGRWNVPPPVRCHRCTALAVAQHGEKYHHASALFWQAHKR